MRKILVVLLVMFLAGPAHALSVINDTEVEKELYKLIIHSNNEDKMRVLGSVTKDMMCQLIDNNPQQAREYLNML